MWWIKFYVDGRPFYESTGMEHEQDARRILDTRRAPAGQGIERQHQRELALLGRMLRLAYEHNRLARVPKFTKLVEAPPRSGFVDQAALEAVRRHLPADLQVAVTVAYTFGWRRNEVLTLEQRQLDLSAGTLRLDPGSTKNGDGRLCYLAGRRAPLGRHEADGAPDRGRLAALRDVEPGGPQGRGRAPGQLQKRLHLVPCA